MYFSANGLRDATFHGYVNPPDEEKGETEADITIYPFGLLPEGQLRLDLSIAEAETLAAKLTELAQAARRGDYSSYESRGRSH
ncbi:hypothetical protein [Nocardia amamiensis]|uniref:hypothetical protein n=1 Tax=Nocardia amamiensis TaxID=404578 RepID=UPI0033E3A3D4